MARYIVTGTSARRAGLRRAGPERRAQVARSTAADAGSDAEEITKTGTERATSVSKGNAAYAAMEAVIMAREWRAEAKRVHDQKFVEAAEAEETYCDAIRRTLEKNEALEKHVKTVTHESGLFGGHRS